MHVVTYIAYITKPEKFHIELNQKLLIYFVLYHTNLIGPLQVIYFTYTPVKCESSAHILLIQPVIFMTSLKWH